MIDRNEFQSAWAMLCERFGKTYEGNQAAAYYRYLNDQMDTEGFVRAARALWATARWFPRPADFLLVGAAGEWALVLAAAEAYTPPAWEWSQHWQRMTERGREACRAIGGMTTIRALWERDVTKLKAEWERAFEQSMAAEVLSLPAPNLRKLPA